MLPSFHRVALDTHPDGNFELELAEMPTNLPNSAEVNKNKGGSTSGHPASASRFNLL